MEKGGGKRGHEMEKKKKRDIRKKGREIRFPIPFVMLFKRTISRPGPSIVLFRVVKHRKNDFRTDFFFYVITLNVRTSPEWWVKIPPRSQIKLSFHPRRVKAGIKAGHCSCQLALARFSTRTKYELCGPLIPSVLLHRDFGKVQCSKNAIPALSVVSCLLFTFERRYMGEIRELNYVRGE